MTILGVGHVNVVCADLDAACRFYRELLGLDAIARAPGGRRDGAWFQLGAQELHLSLEPGADLAGSEGHFALLVSSLAELTDRFARAGWPVVPGRQVPGMERCFVRDPSGNLIELQELARPA